MHIPVLLQEVIGYFNPQPGQKFIDATVDGGGHALAVLERIVPNGKLLGIEWDTELLKNLKQDLENTKFKDNAILINDSYVNLKTIAETNNFTGVQGVLFDLGLSSWHLEESGRGFSFQKDEPLNMRLAPYLETLLSEQVSYGIGRSQRSQIKTGLTAEQIVNQFREEELTRILKEFGEERFAKSIAGSIVKSRQKQPITSTFQLVEVIKNSVPFWYRSGGRRIHFATRTFQAIRIAVNNELENVELGLKAASEVLANGGRLAVISFHSLEDRIIKNFFNQQSLENILKIVTKKPIRAGLEEITKNPRARSAKLRVAEKITK